MSTFFKKFNFIFLKQQKALSLPCRAFASEAEISAEATKQKISKAMKAYLERAKAHEEFMKHEKNEFEIGRRHLANMMGAEPESFTQEDIDQSIAYLLPSGLHEPKARPIMRPPEEVFPKTKAAEFDVTGRPYHCFFYTTRPNFSALLHKSSDILEELDAYEDKMIRLGRKPDDIDTALKLVSSRWIGIEALEKIVIEKLVEVEYDKFITVMERIVNHPYGYRALDFVSKFRTELMAGKKIQTPEEPKETADGRRSVTISNCIRKSTRGSVTVTVPGTGKFSINGKGIDYFTSDFARSQILFPLLFTGMDGRVDIEAEMKYGGETGQSGATRYGIAMALRSFVDPQLVEKMRLAGLLTLDFRRRERKKPGQEGARRKYTWKKR